MEIQSLAPISALSGGAHLWLLPHPQNSKWARLVDWYLNLQVYRMELRPYRDLAPELSQMVRECELPYRAFKAADPRALMVSSQTRLPNSETVFLNESGLAWLNLAQTVWNRMRKPSLRLFLPPDLPPELIGQSWDAREYVGQIGLVTELA